MLDDLAAAGPVQIVRDGAALLLRRGEVLVRVRPAADAAIAHREVAVARALTAADVPVTALVEGLAQPAEVEGCVVTAWAWSEGGAAVTATDVGELARALRERTGGVTGGLAVFDPVAAILREVAHLPSDDAEAAFVRRRAAELAEPWAEAASVDPAGRVVVHGDLHASNVVSSPTGPLLTDLEQSGSGPAGYDTAAAVVAVIRYGGRPSALEAFLDASGDDPRRRPGFATFVALYEVWVTARTVGVRQFDPAWAAEASRRVATLRDGADHTWVLR